MVNTSLMFFLLVCLWIDVAHRQRFNLIDGNFICCVYLQTDTLVGGKAARTEVLFFSY